MKYVLIFSGFVCAFAMSSIARADFLPFLAGNNQLTDQDSEYVSDSANAPAALSTSGQISVGDTFTSIMYFTDDNANGLPNGMTHLEGIATFSVTGVTNQNVSAAGFADITLHGTVTLYENQSTPIGGSGNTLGTADSTTLLNDVKSGTQMFTLTGDLHSGGTNNINATQVPYTLAALTQTSIQNAANFSGIFNVLSPSDVGGAYTGFVPSNVAVSLTDWANTNANGLFTHDSNGNVIVNPSPTSSQYMLLSSSTQAQFTTPEPSSALICLGLTGVAGLNRMRRRRLARS